MTVSSDGAEDKGLALGSFVCNFSINEVSDDSDASVALRARVNIAPESVVISEAMSRIDERSSADLGERGGDMVREIRRFGSDA